MHLSIFIRYLNIVPPLNCIVVYIFQNRHYIFIFLQYEGLSWFKTDANLWASHFYQFYNIHDQGHRWNICLGGFWLHNGHNNCSSGMSHLDACCIYKYQTLSRTCHSHNIQINDSSVQFEFLWLKKEGGIPVPCRSHRCCFVGTWLV